MVNKIIWLPFLAVLAFYASTYFFHKRLTYMNIAIQRSRHGDRDTKRKRKREKERKIYMKAEI